MQAERRSRRLTEKASRLAQQAAVSSSPGKQLLPNTVGLMTRQPPGILLSRADDPEPQAAANSISTQRKHKAPVRKASIRKRARVAKGGTAEESQASEVSEPVELGDPKKTLLGEWQAIDESVLKAVEEFEWAAKYEQSCLSREALDMDVVAPGSTEMKVYMDSYGENTDWHDDAVEPCKRPGIDLHGLLPKNEYRSLMRHDGDLTVENEWSRKFVGPAKQSAVCWCHIVPVRVCYKCRSKSGCVDT